MSYQRPYLPEARERAVRRCSSSSTTTARGRSRDVAIRSIADKLGCSSEALRGWVRQTEQNAGERPGLTTNANPVRPATALATGGYLPLGPLGGVGTDANQRG